MELSLADAAIPVDNRVILLSVNPWSDWKNVLTLWYSVLAPMQAYKLEPVLAVVVCRLAEALVAASGEALPVVPVLRRVTSVEVLIITLATVKLKL